MIPLIKNNDWRNIKTKSNITDEVESQAVKELIDDASKRNETWDERGKTDLNLTIPLLMQNKIPEGYETDDKLDVSLRAEEPEEADFEEMPIEQFGLAMLRGMGWNEGEGIGKNQKQIAPVEAILRPKGMGLGADRSQATQLNKSKMVANSDNKDEEQLLLKAGSHCVIQKGSNKDLYGTIEGLDEDNARVMVKLSLGGKIVTLSQYNIKLVSKTEFNKYSKYINKGKADKYKEKEEKKRERDDSDAEQDNKKHKKHKHDRERDRYSDREDKDNRHKYKDEKHKKRSHREKDREDSDEYRVREKREEYRDRERRDEYRDRERRKETEERLEKYSNQNGNGREDVKDLKGKTTNGNRSDSYFWVRPNIRVRIISQNYKKGKYFNTKVNVIDVVSPDNCVCRTDNGTVLENLTQSDMETVIPKMEKSFVILVSSKHRGQLAELMSKDKKNCKATVQLLKDRDEVLQVDYDSICEYIGDIHEEFDY